MSSRETNTERSDQARTRQAEASRHGAAGSSGAGSAGDTESAGAGPPAAARVTQVTGRAVPVVGDDIDTDQIIPARFLKEITFSAMGEYPFYDERFDSEGAPKDHPFNRPEYQGARILLANVNFGCGSSREHAPQALTRWGIKAVVAESFAEIFAGNCTMLGVPPVTASKEDVAKLQELAAAHPETELVVDLEAMEVCAPAPPAQGVQAGTADDSAQSRIVVPIEMPKARRQTLMEGMWDSTALLLSNAELVDRTAERLPYIRWSRAG